jgi:hypothetical protein
MYTHRYFKLTNKKGFKTNNCLAHFPRKCLKNVTNTHINNYYLFFNYFFKCNILHFGIKKNSNIVNKLTYNYINLFIYILNVVYQRMNFYLYNPNYSIDLNQYINCKALKKIAKVSTFKNISKMLTVKFINVINLKKGLNFLFKNYFNFYNYMFLDSTLFFKASNINKNLQNKLIAFSSIFLIKNKYYIINNNICFLNLKYNLNSNYLNIVYFTPITTYTRNVFENNIISKNAVEVQAIIERINNFFSNFK